MSTVRVAPVREHVGSNTPVWKYLIAAALHSGQTSAPDVQSITGFWGSSDGRYTTSLPPFPPVIRTARCGVAIAWGADDIELWQAVMASIAMAAIEMVRICFADIVDLLNGFARVID
jgi:hypothetical protein